MMKNVFKVLFVLFLMNSTGLCANEDNALFGRYNAPLGHPQREEYYVENRRHDEEVTENIRRRILENNTVEDDAEDAVGDDDDENKEKCLICYECFTDENQLSECFIQETCEHNKICENCVPVMIQRSIDTGQEITCMCRNNLPQNPVQRIKPREEYCFEAFMATEELLNRFNYTTEKDQRVKRLMGYAYRDARKKEKEEKQIRFQAARQWENKRKTLVKAGRILRVATYTGLFIQNCREKDRFQAAIKMLILSALMSGDRIIEKALNTIRVSGVTTLKQKLEIIMKECFENMFYMISTNSIPQIFAGFIKGNKLDNIPFIANQLFARSLCSFPTDLYGVATGYNQDIRSKLFVGLETFKSISSVVLNTSIAGSLSFKLDPIPQLLTREQIIDELHLVDPSDSLMKSQLLLNTMVNLVQDVAANERYKKGLGNLRAMVASSAAFTFFELARLVETMPIFNRNLR